MKIDVVSYFHFDKYVVGAGNLVHLQNLRDFRKLLGEVAAISLLLGGFDLNVSGRVQSQLGCVKEGNYVSDDSHLSESFYPVEDCGGRKVGDLADIFEGEGGVPLVCAQDFQIVLIDFRFG